MANDKLPKRKVVWEKNIIVLFCHTEIFHFVFKIKVITREGGEWVPKKSNFEITKHNYLKMITYINNEIMKNSQKNC